MGEVRSERRASPSRDTRAKVRAPPLQQFRVNECWRAPRHRRRAGEHARVRPGRKGETKKDREKGIASKKERERKRTPASGPARAHANDENGSCSWALPRALRRLGSLHTPFYRFASTALVPVPWSLPPSLPVFRVSFTFLALSR